MTIKKKSQKSPFRYLIYYNKCEIQSKNGITYEYICQTLTIRRSLRRIFMHICLATRTITHNFVKITTLHKTKTKTKKRLLHEYLRSNCLPRLRLITPFITDLSNHGQLLQHNLYAFLICFKNSAFLCLAKYAHGSSWYSHSRLHYTVFLNKIFIFKTFSVSITYLKLTEELCSF